MRSQFIVAACLVLLIALAGVRFSVTHSGDHLTTSAHFHNNDDLTPAQQILVGKSIDINTADKQALEVLPLIGPKLAERIVEDRELNGPFTSVYDLARVYGVGQRTIERNLPYIAVK